MESKSNIAIFASGRGSNALNIVNFINRSCHHLNVSCLVCNVEDAAVMNFMIEKGIPVEFIPSKGETSFDHEVKVISALDKYKIDWIILAGYMKVLSPHILGTYKRIVNIHPSVLPLYPGLHSYKRSFENKDPYSGATIHFVDEGVDTGSIIMQKKFPRLSSDSFDQFRRRGLENEYELFRSFLTALNKGESKIFDLVNYFSRSSANAHTENRSISKNI